MGGAGGVHSLPHSLRQFYLEVNLKIEKITVTCLLFCSILFIYSFFILLIYSIFFFFTFLVIYYDYGYDYLLS